MAPKKTTAKKAPEKKKPEKKSVYLVEISRTMYSGVYVKAESPEAAKRLVEDKEIAFSSDLVIQWGDIEYECDGEEYNDEKPYLVDGDDEEDASDEAPEEEAAPAKKKSAKKARTAMTIALPRGVELTMVPIPRKNYWMGKVPVTQAQWRAVMGRNPSEHKGAENPVEHVSWYDCQEFLETLNTLNAVQESGLTFRLPEENEWEYASRAGATGKYCKLADGTEITEETLGEVAWFGEDEGTGSTHPVGQKKPNAFGLHDMQGNVWEWTSRAEGIAFVLRGGNWFFPATFSSRRVWFEPDLRGFDVGFRLCADRRAD